MNKIVTSITLIYLSIGTANAIENKAFAKCAIVDGDLARLECYDKLAKNNNLDGRQVKPISIEDKGKWNVSVDVNPIDDSQTVTLILDSNSKTNRYRKAPYMVLRCKSNETNLYIGWNDYLGSKADILTRVGTNKANTSRWSLSTDKKASFHPKAIPFIKEMLKSNKLIAQVTPYNESPVTAVFDTSGLNNVIKPLRDTCGW
jgi:type VI secretion system protein VasI